MQFFKEKMPCLMASSQSLQPNCFLKVRWDGVGWLVSDFHFEKDGESAILSDALRSDGKATMACV